MSRIERALRRAAAALRRPAALAMAAVLAAGPPLGALAPAAVAAGATAYVETGRQVFYGAGGHTNAFTVNGAQAYCSDPHNDTPYSGTYPVRDAVTRPNDSGTSQHPVEHLRAMVYHAWGGPGYDRSMWPTVDWDGTPVTDDEILAYSHILIADRMWCQGDKALSGTSTAFRRWFCREFLGYEYGTPGGPVTNPGCVAFRFQDAGAPADFRVLELDTGSNSIYRPGYRSQTIITFEPKVTVRFSKTSADAELTAGNPEYSVAGAEYDIFNSRTGEKEAHIVMDASGHAELRLKPNEYYYAVETKAPKGYKRTAARVEFTTGNQSAEERLVDDPGKVYLSIRKKDSATAGPAQPGSSLEGAEYKLVDANGDTHVATTDKNGRLTFEGLPFGKVTVTETKPPEGYKLDPEPHTYHVSSDGMPASGVIELEPEDDFKEGVIAFDIELVKYKDSGAEDSGLQEPAEGVRFDIVSNTTGKTVGSITTDAKGHATTAGQWFGEGERREGVKGALPYDSKGYTVHEDEATTPEGYRPCPDWQIGPKQMADGANLYYIVDNDFVSSHIQVVKVDAATGQNVALAGFRFKLLDGDKNPITQEVWYPNHAEMDEFATDESGMVTFPEGLKPGTYYIREVEAKSPYLLNGEDLKVVIPNLEELDPVTVVKLADEQALGRATIVKTCSEDGSALEGAEYDVVALEDVVSPDGSVRAVEGEVVDHVETDGDGTAVTKDLYLGGGTARYAFVETKAPEGHVLDATPHEFTLSYADQHTPVVEARVEASDAPTHVTVLKTDGGTGEPLAGAEFALWAASDEIPAASDERDVLAVRAPEGADVHAVKVVDHAKVNMTAADGLEFTLRDDGGVELDRGIDGTWTVPQGVYTMTAAGGGEEVASVEVKARAGRGYDLSLEKGLLGAKIAVEELVLEWDTPLEWSGADGAHLAYGLEGEHRVTVDGRAVGAVDIEGDVYAEVDGPELTTAPVLLKDGKEADIHATDDDGLIDVRHLPAGEYRLREVSAPEGYLVDPRVRSFTIAEDGLVDGKPVHEVEVADDYTKLELSKLDVTDESEVEGARMALLDGDGEVVEAWVSDGAPHRAERIAPGDYTLVEEMTPREYDQATAVEFEVLPTGAVQRVAMHDEPISISAEVDKRQQIADPTAPETEPDGDGANRAEATVSEDGSFDYSVDFRSTSSTWVDEFTVEDDLSCAAEGLAVLDSITLPVAGDDFDGLLNVWYRTDGGADGDGEAPAANATLLDGHANPWLSDSANAESLGEDGRALDYAGWHLWAADASALEASELKVSDLGLAEGEAVTGIRLEYGRVEEGFTSRADGWDREDLKDPHDDYAGEPASGRDDAIRVQGRAVVTLGDGSEAELDPAVLGRAEDGAGWMIDMDGDGAPEFYPEEAVSMAGEAEAERSPLVLHMRATDAYRPGTELRNGASVHAYRNGGGEGLEAHDADEVLQAPKSTVKPLAQTGAAPTRLVAAAVLAGGALLALAAWRRLRPPERHVTDCFGRSV